MVTNISLRRSLLGVLAMSLALSWPPSVGAQYTVGRDSNHPASLLVASVGNSPFLFVADPERGAIYRHPLRADGTNFLALNDFEELFRSPQLPAPTALAFYHGKILFTEYSTSTLVELDPVTLQARTLLSPPRIQHPISLAVSETGVIAIGEDNPDQIVIYSPHTGEQSLYLGKDEPARLGFIGGDLIILSQQTGVLSLLSDRRERTQPAEPTTRIIEAFKKNLLPLSDFAYFRGIFYALSRDNQIAIFAPAGGANRAPLLLKSITEGSPTLHIAAYANILLVQSKEFVFRLARPTVASVGFEVPPDKSPADVDSIQYGALVSLYTYMEANGLLPTRDVEAQHAYPSLKALLWQEDILIRRPTAHGIPAENPEAESRLGRLLCRLNESDCWSQAGNFLNKNVAAGQKVRLPGISLEKSLTTSKVSLGDKTVQEHLSERVIPTQLSDVKPDDLLRLNRRFLQTWEDITARDNLLALEQPGAKLEPGMVVNLKKGPRVSSSVSEGCNLNLGQIHREEVLGRPLAPIKATGDILPRSYPSAQEAGVNHANGIELSFDTLIRESIDPDSLSTALESLRSSGNCAGASNRSDLYVVVETRKAVGARYRVLDKNGSLLSLNENEIRRLNLLGHSDPEKRWSLVVDEPVPVAVRLTKLTESQNNEDKEIGGASDILAVKGQVLYLPATKWRLPVFVLPADLKNSLSDIGKLDLIPGVHVLPEESFASMSESVAVPILPPNLQDELMRFRIRENRLALESQIDYMPPLPGLSRLVIGLGENKQSVHCSHPDFLVGGESIWYQEAGEFDLAPITCPSGTTEIGSPPLKEFQVETDHGDHVAGLLAGQGSLAPGLAPGVGLFLIDTSSPAGLEKSIDSAIKRGINLFSFSFTLDNDPALDKLKKTMHEKWSSQIFVAAAGNDGDDLTFLSARPPVSWVDDIENIIGVGASDWSHNVLGAWVPNPSSPQITERGSNFGKKYIQLLAPGLEIYSTASDNRYAIATGSSQAVPQVTAAIAMLLAQAQSGYLDPSAVKSRLVYSSDWYSPNFDNKVWGGSLNYRRSVWRPDLNLLREKSDTSTVSFFEFSGNASITIEEGEIDDPRGDAIDPPKTIPFKNILRIQWIDADKRWRVIYLENGSSQRKMRVMRGCLISGSVPCSQLQKWDPARSAFTAGNQCAGKLDVTDIFDYIARLPEKRVRF